MLLLFGFFVVSLAVISSNEFHKLSLFNAIIYINKYFNVKLKRIHMFSRNIYCIVAGPSQTTVVLVTVCYDVRVSAHLNLIIVTVVSIR